MTGSLLFLQPAGLHKAVAVGGFTVLNAYRVQHAVAVKPAQWCRATESAQVNQEVDTALQIGGQKLLPQYGEGSALKFAAIRRLAQ